MIATSAQALISPPFGSGALPQDAVYAGGFTPLVGGYSFHSHQLGVERVDNQMLNRFNTVPSVFFHSLCDTHLQPSDLPLRFFPVDGFPRVGIVDECTSSVGRHLLSHLQRFYLFSRNKTPVGRLHAHLPGRMPSGFGAKSCCRLYLPAFPKAFASSNFFLPLLHRHALRLACLKLHQAENGVATFHTVDPMDDLGGISTPGVLWVPCRQLRDLHPDFHAANTGKRPRPANPRRSVLIDDAAIL